MKKILIIMFTALILCSCKKSPDTKGDSVNLITVDDPNLFAKSVILFEDDNYLIKTPLDSFVNGYPFTILDGYYVNYKNKAIEDSRTNDLLQVADYMPNNISTSHTLAYHLEKGSCSMFDKISTSFIKSISVEHYSEGEPMASHSGRRFYIGDKLFLTTVDLISK